MVKRLSAVLLLSATTSAGAQPMVATIDNPLQVAASYGYSQVHLEGSANPSVRDSQRVLVPATGRRPRLPTTEVELGVAYP